jgi:hypothetical protein
MSDANGLPLNPQDDSTTPWSLSLTVPAAEFCDSTSIDVTEVAALRVLVDESLSPGPFSVLATPLPRLDTDRPAKP